MKNVKFINICIVIWSIALIGFILLTHLYPFSRSETVEAGQVWILESDNPYNTWCQTNTVLEVKDDYVLYHNGTYEDSSSMGYFVIGSKRIK